MKSTVHGLRSTAGQVADPYHDRKVRHKAAYVDKNGNVSPLCAEKPRPLNLRKETWVLRDQDVTCRLCRSALAVDRRPSAIDPGRP